jgi:hypothetical protein
MMDCQIPENKLSKFRPQVKSFTPWLCHPLPRAKPPQSEVVHRRRRQALPSASEPKFVTKRATQEVMVDGFRALAT